MYVNKTDYIGTISTSLLNILIAEDAVNIIADTSKQAEDTIATMVGVLYDIAPELLKVANERNGYILNLAISIGLYNIYQRADDESIPQKVIKNYDDAMNDLKLISTGKQALSLPPKPVDTTGETAGTVEDAGIGGTGIRRIGSAAKRTHHI
jgi:hypothetical protein